MQTFIGTLCLGLLIAQPIQLPQLRELLNDRQDPRGQAHAALLLLQSSDPVAEQLIRQGLRQLENEETFAALATAIRLHPNNRFLEELLAALGASKPRVRQLAGETLAALPFDTVTRRLADYARDERADLRVRQMALWTLGRSGRKEAAGVLVDFLEHDSEDLRRLAATSLTELTGQGQNNDTAQWQAWWKQHKDLTAEQWLQIRLAFQTSRAQRLEGDLNRARAAVVRLHQQLYSRLPIAERFSHLQGIPDQDDPGVRSLAIVWCLELLPAADLERQKILASVLLRLTHDSNGEVQRAAVLALGRLPDASAFERLVDLLKNGNAVVRAAAVRALSLQARGSTPEAQARLQRVIPLLQKSLEDSGLDVVVEAAEALGMLGAPEAGSVLIGLLGHPSQHVRQTAAQALERTAESSHLEKLLNSLEEPIVTVRFSLVGAVGRAAGNGQSLSAEMRTRLVSRLEELLRRDADAGIRSRAATVLGECGQQEALPILWQQVLNGTESRVQQKAWDAFVEILMRLARLPLVEQWDRTLREAKQQPKRLHLWAQLYARWDQNPATRELALNCLENLVQIHLEASNWTAAHPLVQTLLARLPEGGEARRRRCLNWLVQFAELALKEGHRAEVVRIVQDARPHLAADERLKETFDRFERIANGKE